MKQVLRALTALNVVMPVLMGGLFVMESSAQAVNEIGGQKIVNP